MAHKKISRIPGFYELSVSQRLDAVREFAGLNEEEVRAITQGAPPAERLNYLVENAIGSIGIPLGIATNFLINGKEYLIPMATDESSVIAGASNGAKLARIKGGIKTSSSEPLMAVHIQIGSKKHQPKEIEKKIHENKKRLIEMANTRSTSLPKIGAGAKDIQVYSLEGFHGSFVIARLMVDVRDAMGANIVNTMAEYISPEIEKITGETVYLKVVDNYCAERVARAECVIDREALGGWEVLERFLEGYSCAYHDVHRACGHNKGVMNGITAVVLATGNDTRAVESACHVYAARSGKYRPLPEWEKNAQGDLTGKIEIPVPVGIIGGLTKNHPVALACIKILGVKTARELGEVLAAVGLASKLAAERALAHEGIQQGHMSLHAANIAMMAGAKANEIGRIADEMVREKNISTESALRKLKRMKSA